MSSGVPTPIKYLGRRSGSIGASYSIMASINACGSPTASPPMA
jgi:hypothetical protein